MRRSSKNAHVKIQQTQSGFGKTSRKGLLKAHADCVKTIRENSSICSNNQRQECRRELGLLMPRVTCNED